MPPDFSVHTSQTEKSAAGLLVNLRISYVV